LARARAATVRTVAASALAAAQARVVGAASAAASAVTAERRAALAADARVLSEVLAQAEARVRRAGDAAARLRAELDSVAQAAVDPARLAAVLAEAAASDAALAAAREHLNAAELAHARAGPSAAARDAQGRADASRLRLAVEADALAAVLAAGNGERWPPVMDQMQVPAGLEAALGAALGEGLAAASDPGAARHWRTLPALPDRPVPGEALSALVQASPALARALAGIGVVRDDAAGEAGQPGLLPGQCLVSRVGALWRWDGYSVRAGRDPALAAAHPSGRAAHPARGGGRRRRRGSGGLHGCRRCQACRRCRGGPGAGLAALLRQHDALGPVNLRATVEAAMQATTRVRDELATAIAALRGTSVLPDRSVKPTAAGQVALDTAQALARKAASPAPGPPRQRVTATVGTRAPSAFGLDGLLDFHAEMTLEGERLAEQDGLTFAEAMRMLAGAAIATEDDHGATADWSRVTAGPWLAETLQAVRAPDGTDADPGPARHAPALSENRREWLHLLSGLGLGDDMGLGKNHSGVVAAARSQPGAGQMAFCHPG